MLKPWAWLFIIIGCYLRLQGQCRGRAAGWAVFQKAFWYLQTVRAAKPNVKYCAVISQDYPHGTDRRSCEGGEVITQDAKPAPSMFNSLLRITPLGPEHLQLTHCESQGVIANSLSTLMKTRFKVSLATPFPRHSWVRAPEGWDARSHYCSLTSCFVSAERWWQPPGTAEPRWFNSVYPAVRKGWVTWDLLTLAVKEKRTDVRHKNT